MVHIFNTSLGKELNNYYAHEDSVVKIFYSPFKNNLITNGADSTCKLWDLSNNNKIPTNVYYDTESTIVSCDFRVKDGLHIAIDEDGHFAMRNFKEGKKDSIKTRYPKEKYKFLKFNQFNDYQYFLSTESSFKIYDIRNNLEMDTVPEFKNSLDIFNDSKNYFVIYKDGVYLYTFFSSKLEKLKQWNDLGIISHCNMNSVNYSNPEVILIGCENGDVYYSKN